MEKRRGGALRIFVSSYMTIFDKGAGNGTFQTVDKTVRDVMSANRFFTHFQFSNLNFETMKKSL
ncbi:hypothetical protein DWV84_26895 [Blautia sp. AF13-16]